ncbi:sulfite exporter TauE/SafE family protein [Halocalculus aciditolerans]|uniref:Urease accessory protein UreH-like transmembrane domain-containing protein n=1 Tax=Halocalculus aciditolerans TaxID=1383812 RepID=A0A830F6Q4_9EURY|nr:sulfite exporter TauE/SafE family protein [Halocalculus aciditolerans]GGL59923.1 hypothetical protein GCM10009039_17720 [Halocalculus aciditolerans]
MPGQPLELAAFFVVGLLGGAHCLGMCGPLVSTYAGRMSTDSGPPTWFELRQHALFNLGRTASYAAVGALMGFLGSAVYVAAGYAALGDTIRGVFGVLVGGFILAVGVVRVAGGSAHSLLPEGPGGALFSRVSGWAVERMDDFVDSPKIALLGTVHAVLPCPLLYPAFVYAFAQGDPAAGALNLAVLGVGTIPAMFLLGTVMGTVSATRRQAVERALGVVFVLLAFVPLLMGFRLLGVPVPMIPLPYSPL